MTIDNELMTYCEKAKKINEDNLMKILSDNKDTQYGRKHDFCSIKSIDDYRKAVPPSNYSEFEGYIERMRGGEENVLTVYPLAGFCRTSGSTGRSKYIPLSRTALERYSDYFERWRTEYLHSIGGQRFLINAFRNDISKPQKKEALFSEFYFRSMYEKGHMDMNEYIGGEKMIFVKSEFDIQYAKVREALCYKDIKLLECQFMYELLGFFDYIEKNWKSLLHDIKTHTVPDSVKLPSETASYLNSLEPSDERLDEIRKECESGFDGIAKRLWKKLSLISGVSNKSYLTEKAALNKYISGIPQHHLCYCASECYIGTPYDIDSYEYVMLPQNAFYEFLPIGQNSGNTLLPHELKTGELYEPVITNFSGLYRYKMSDVVKITGYLGENPIMEFMFRKGQALNIAGEKYDTTQLEQAVYSLRKQGVNIDNYCAASSLDVIPGKYVVVMAVNDCELTEKEVSVMLDRSLCRYNSEYDDLRNTNGLGMTSVILCSPGRFAEFMCSIGANHKYGHNKPHHLLKGEVSEKTWRSILERIK